MDKHKQILAKEWFDAARSDFQSDIPDYTKEEIVEAFEKAREVKEAIEMLIKPYHS